MTQTENKISCTIGVLTFNSEKNLSRALESVKDFAEVILADGGSTDGTLEIARAAGARVVSQSNPGHPIADYARERNILLDAATQPWFFHLDSDEIMSPELVDFIRSIAGSAEPYKAYRVRYLKTNEDGTKPYRTLKEYYQVRLARTDIGARYARAVHERMIIPAGIAIGQTEAPWYVPLDKDDLSAKVFIPKAWKRIGVTANEWKPKGPLDAFKKVVGEPVVLIAKSLIKIPMVKIKWGRNAIPVKYELLRIAYSFMLGVRHFGRLIRGRSKPSSI